MSNVERTTNAIKILEDSLKNGIEVDYNIMLIDIGKSLAVIADCMQSLRTNNIFTTGEACMQYKEEKNNGIQ